MWKKYGSLPIAESYRIILAWQTLVDVITEPLSLPSSQVTVESSPAVRVEVASLLTILTLAGAVTSPGGTLQVKDKIQGILPHTAAIRAAEINLVSESLFCKHLVSMTHSRFTEMIITELTIII